jgi:hypothetical protein
MTVPVLTQSEFIEFLKERGFKIIEDKYWDDFDRIIFEKDGETFPFQMQEKYYFPIVCRICSDFGVNAPPDHQKCHDQIVGLRVKGKKK